MTEQYDSSTWEMVRAGYPDVGDWIVCRDNCVRRYEGGAPVSAWPIVSPRVRDLAWALGEMARHPMREYGYGGARYRWNGDDRCFEFYGDAYDEWTLTSNFSPKGVASTDWRALPEEPASAEPLTLESLAARVATLEAGPTQCNIPRGMPARWIDDPEEGGA